MKKLSVIICLCLIAGLSTAQNVQQSKSIQIKFFSSAPLEDIEAITQNGTSVLTTNKNEIFFLVPIKSFTFKSSMMQEHFNENYMESDKYPDARFSGKITSEIDWGKDGVYEVNAKGKFTVHGVSQERTLPGTISIKNGVISVQSKFEVSCKAHDIKIPSVMTEKIAETVEVSINGEYAPFVKK